MPALPESWGDDGSLIAALTVAAFLLLLYMRAFLNLRSLPELRLPASLKNPDCMVVIPARNEASSIERAVRSFPPDTVIVVDDGSSDNTGGLARAAGAGVIPAPLLQRGATGKSNACAAGAAPLKSRWLLFADADTWFEPAFLEAAVAACESSQVSFLSVYPKPESESFLEHMLTPLLHALYFAGTNPKATPAEAFNGQVVVARRETYEFLGGHRAVLRESVDDIHMAFLAERHRVKYALARAHKLSHIRMYRGAAGIWNGFERQAVRHHLGSPARALLSLLTYGVSLLWLPVLAWLVFDRHWIAVAGFALLPFLLLRDWYPNTLRSLLAPFAIYTALPFVAHAVLTAATGRAVEWKGRRV
jgi:hypothetical protein